jgi:membrane protein involved in colicin uptake
MAKAKAIKKLAEKLKAQKKKQTVLSKKTQARNKAAVPKMVKDALKKEVRSMRKAERRKLIKATLDDIFSGKQSKLNPFTKKHSGGVVRKQAGGFVHRRNQRRQG